MQQLILLQQHMLQGTHESDASRSSSMDTAGIEGATNRVSGDCNIVLWQLWHAAVAMDFYRGSGQTNTSIPQ